ncbi:hypothetical protein CLIB1423_19S01486 [[Candida] railenensis]|uniref:Uncharacterized protein n=1 Tax=[Candida] railenensis TaxID=45579 RepID=A0A9P0QSP7_9ASCO|nr:hypothetical protein CLIB1423_19S01486 [[Candida] railenensis]
MYLPVHDIPDLVQKRNKIFLSFFFFLLFFGYFSFKLHCQNGLLDTSHTHSLPPYKSSNYSDSAYFPRFGVALPNSKTTFLFSSYFLPLFSPVQLSPLLFPISVRYTTTSDCTKRTSKKKKKKKKKDKRDCLTKKKIRKT